MTASLTETPPVAPKTPQDEGFDYQLAAEACGYRLTLFVQSIPAKTAGKRREEYDLLGDLIDLEMKFQELALDSARLHGHP